MLESEWASADGSLVLYRGDCVAIMREMLEASVDAVVTDPPAGIGFMGREWDDFRRSRNPEDAKRDNVFGRTSAHGPEYARRSREAFVAFMRTVMLECLRVLKPGGYALVWAIPRTSHWTTWAVEDAGFEIRDVIVHLYGQGFPKSLDVSKAIDDALGTKREVVGLKPGVRGADGTGYEKQMPGKAVGVKQVGCLVPVTKPATPEAARWEGWGTALKPASEHWILARKPLDGTVAQNVLRHGVGGINIDACRIPRSGADSGSWPGNAILSHSPDCVEAAGSYGCVPDCPVRMLDEQSGFIVSSRCSSPAQDSRQFFGSFRGIRYGGCGYSDAGGASRFFYTPKASRKERDDGLDDFGPVQAWEVQGRKEGTAGSKHPRAGIRSARVRNTHPTVKPVALMEYLVKLVTPKGGLVLDPFVGSGTTMVACARLGFRCAGIDLDPSYARIAVARACREREKVGMLAADEARTGQQLGLLSATQTAGEEVDSTKSDES